MSLPVPASPRLTTNDLTPNAASVFVTAFEPFGHAVVNGSQAALARWMQRDLSVTGAVLPVVRGDAERAALGALPAGTRLWIALGEAGPEPIVRLEKVAINWDDFRIPDNAGNQPRDTPIAPDGPDAYFATAAVSAAVAALHDQTPLPVRISLSAGAFLCNRLAYTALHAHVPCPFAFVHVPNWRPEGPPGAFAGPDTLESLVTTLIALKDALLKRQAVTDLTPNI